MFNYFRLVSKFGLLIFGTALIVVNFGIAEFQERMNKVKPNELIQQVPEVVDLTSPAVTIATPTPVNQPVQKSANNKVVSKIDCTGPDGVVFQTTQKECDDFNIAWGNVSLPQSYSKTINSSLIDCTVKGKVYRLSPNDCIIFSDYIYSLDRMAQNYEANNQALLNQFNQGLDEISNRKFDSSIDLPEVTLEPFPTIQPIPEQKDCFRIGNSDSIICK